MTRFYLGGVLVMMVALSRQAGGQSLARRIREIGDGTVQFSFASRPGVCGDGATYVRDGFGDDNRIYEGGNFSGHSHGDDWPPCRPGPVRVVATVSGGEFVRLKTYAGPLPDESVSGRRDLGVVSVGDAVAFLTGVIEQAHGRSASDAILPIVLADSLTPWPVFIRFARDEHLSKVRSSVDFWLARGAAAALGVVSRGEDTDDDVRGSAVFALSQQQKEVAVPRLIEIVRHNSHPAARAQALFWLGQSGDSRAIDLFDDILRRR